MNDHVSFCGQTEDDEAPLHVWIWQCNTGLSVILCAGVHRGRNAQWRSSSTDCDDAGGTAQTQTSTQFHTLLASHISSTV